MSRLSKWKKRQPLDQKGIMSNERFLVIQARIFRKLELKGYDIVLVISRNAKMLREYYQPQT